MAVRRGVIVVLVLILVAVAISTAGLLFMGLAVGRGPLISSNSTLLLDVRGGLQETEPSGVLGAVHRGAAYGAIDRRLAAQGERRSARVERHHPADQRRRALGQGAGSARRDHRVQEVEEADHRLPRVRRRSVLLPGERLRQGLPHADGVARPHRYGELRALPARRAGQDRRVSRRHPRRRLQDGVEHVHRTRVHAGPPRDGRVPQHRSLRTADRRPRRGPPPDGGGDTRRSSITGRSCPRTPCARGSSTTWPTRTRSTTRWSSDAGAPACCGSTSTAAVGLGSLGTQSRAEDCRHLRRRDDQLRRQHRFGGQPGARLRHHGRVPAHGARGQLDSRHRAPDRQPRRIGRLRPTSSGARSC